MKLLLPFCVMCLLVGCASQSALQEAQSRQDAQAQQLQKQESDIATLFMRLDDVPQGQQLDEQQFYQDNQQLLTQVRQLQTQVQALQADLQRLTKELQVLQGRRAATPTTEAQQPAPSTNGSETAMYDRAREYYTKGQYTQAANLFRDFLKSYPAHALASNAQYWLGECYYSLDSFPTARNEFQKVVDFYSDSPKAPDALVKIALTYKKQGQREQARLELERIKRLYPGYERMELVNSLLVEVQ